MKRIKQEHEVSKESLLQIPLEGILKRKFDEEFSDFVSINFPMNIGETARPDVIRLERTLFISSENPVIKISKMIDDELKKLEELNRDSLSVGATQFCDITYSMKKGLEIAKNIIEKQSEE